MNTKFKELDFDEVQNQVIEQLKKGIFLTTQVGQIPNTMTIAWANSGQMWGKNSFVVAVRHSRYTFELMEDSEYFTVSIPRAGSLKKELGFCGTISGRDRDKFKEVGLTPSYLEDIPVPLIEECALHIVCKIAYKQAMEPSLIQADYVKQKYKTNDYHTMYHGEVIGVYESIT
ncbi:flavin reductase family protein [Fusibacter sp. JL216-2]|uniref:flavin reductase family protein n=1 Tax=Fusibacter sp. JL216-2 TaxID=3071453 RepID=UPI003D33B159